MKKAITIFLTVFLISTYVNASELSTKKDDVTFVLNVENYSDDLFHVTVYPPQLKEGNSVFNFASTVPGVYSRRDYGRFIKSFMAFDKNDREIQVEKIGINEWQISNPDRVKKIVYDIEDTFDSDVKGNHVLPMEGTGIEDNYILLNTFGVFGYFQGMQSSPIKLKIEYPTEWELGSALNISDEGYYEADSFDHLADSPFLLGELSISKTKVNDIDVEIYVNSPTQEILADTVMVYAKDALSSASEFITYAPVDKYTFLMVFTDMESMKRNKFRGMGALEHSYSSTYFVPAMKDYVTKQMESTIAHEFFHIVTPLNIHSEIIERFNFSQPVASEHLWFYEGVTEWAADIMRLRSGVINLDEYLKLISKKIGESESFGENLSLSRLGLECYTEKGSEQYRNIYEMGAIVGAIMDIKLLHVNP